MSDRVCLGRAGGLLAVALAAGPAAGQCDEPILALYGDDQWERFGYSVGHAGDVDGDGVPDVIVGAPEDDDWRLDAGSATVFSGATGLVIHAWHGDLARDRFGESVAGAGDVDGDGFDDLVVGAIHADVNGDWSGTTTVFSGATGAILHQWHGEGELDRLGSSVGSAGDVDGDGSADLIVGGTGIVVLYSGGTGLPLQQWHGGGGFTGFGQSSAGVGDVDGDGVPDVVVGAWADDTAGPDSGLAIVFSGATGQAIHTWYGERDGHHFGAAVSGTGDVNGDGRNDVIVGSRGGASVFSGATGDRLYTYLVPGHNGWPVGGGGDVNGDGTPDFIIGAPRDTTGGSYAGAAHVYSGATGRLLQSWYGGLEDQLGWSVDAFGDLDGDGREDVLLGVIAADFQGSRAGGAYVFAADCACPADIDGDGDADVNDFFAYLDLFAAGDPRADIDGDGDVDVNDFFAYLDVFMAGC